jgi:hypothetical protein
MGYGLLIDSMWGSKLVTPYQMGLDPSLLGMLNIVGAHHLFSRKNLF